MSDEQKDGGPAFPVAALIAADGTGIMEGANGMTLRDWFAGQALAGVLGAVQPARIDGRPITSGTDFAKWSYAVADAMIAARKEPRHAG